MSTPPAERAALADALGVAVSAEGLQQALVHRSFSYENGAVPTNERLEFLGDAVLQLAVTEELYRRHPDADEGLLSRMRIAVVSGPALARVARRLGVGPAVLLGRGEAATGGADRDSILADTVEAIIGAVHVELGPQVSRELVLRITGPLLETAHAEGLEHDPKTVLQVLAASLEQGSPVYELTGEGPSHDPRFTARVRLGDGEIVGTGTGRSKKTAEQAAAGAAVQALRGA